jgi:hypothetical protein
MHPPVYLTAIGRSVRRTFPPSVGATGDAPNSQASRIASQVSEPWPASRH